jgi:hypothetical protein
VTMVGATVVVATRPLELLGARLSHDTFSIGSR